MPFKLPNFVWKKTLAALLLSAFFLSPAKAIEDDVFSLKGQVQGLRGVNVQHMALRSDGRYLFYSTGGASWNVIDLLDMVTKAAEDVAVDASVQGLFLDGDRRLIVATTEGAQYFDVTEVFEPEEETKNGAADKYVRPTSAQTSVESVCMNAAKTLYFLEISSIENRYNIIRSVADKKDVDEVEWATLFPSFPNRLTPDGIIRCAANEILLGAEDLEEADFNLTIARMAYSSFGSSAETYVIPDDALGVLKTDVELFDIKDFVLSPAKDRAFLMFNAALESFQDKASHTQILSLPTSLSGDFSIGMGAAGAAIAAYRLSETDYLSFFMGLNYFDSVLNPDADQLLTLPMASFSSSLPSNVFGDDEDRGEAVYGSSSIGSVMGSEWLSTKNDQYVYGLSESSGVSLLTKGPSLEFSVSPGSTLTSSQPLSFGLISDREVKVEIRYDPDADPKGDSGGLDFEKGRLIKSLYLTKDTAQNIQITASELSISKNGDQGITIFAQPKEVLDGSQTARLGATFSYDPPPKAVTGFRLGAGDQSIHVYFSTNLSSDDIREVQVYFSYTASDLDTLPTSDIEKVAWSRTVTGVGSRSLTSPTVLPSSGSLGKHVIAPIENNQDICVRVLVVDTSGQYSDTNPAALCDSPVKTRSLAAAFGGTNSCAMTPLGSMPVVFLFFLLLVSRYRWIRSQRFLP
ncbi:MAG: hypothetical protein COV44_04895 [Deltaproteobacteria bacterium CG11_big_fil_rev_8_21_14_0_20_45_16]|nr:MAG: hypothetical protein COV44_04895 [Deltaproteobacteria bacterium CG11_big_fil_rev_8_21_14_0_20_45_16]